MLKQELRKEYKIKRSLIDSKQFEMWNDLILIQFQTVELPFIHNVFSYFPMEENNEPETFLITRYLKFLNPQLQVAYPTMQPNDTMLAIIANEDSEYMENSYGILELETGPILHPKDVDIVIVPMLVCDYKGNRVGYGKGFYDKYLAQCKKDVLKIGLSFFDPIDKITDIQPHDVPLTHCITTDIVYEF
jgi:5-formyltetrahydrofolate cyclo-ligase